MTNIKHFIRLLVEFGYYTVVNRTIWPLSLIILLLSLATVVVAGHAFTPFIYAVF